MPIVSVAVDAFGAILPYRCRPHQAVPSADPRFLPSKRSRTCPVRPGRRWPPLPFRPAPGRTVPSLAGAFLPVPAFPSGAGASRAIAGLRLLSVAAPIVRHRGVRCCRAIALPTVAGRCSPMLPCRSVPSCPGRSYPHRGRRSEAKPSGATLPWALPPLLPCRAWTELSMPIPTAAA